jgi:hypothetical protein
MVMPGAGRGGTPPPPPGYQPPQLPGVAAGSVNIFRGRLVIVTGPGSAIVGVFVYAQGTVPAAGNPPIFWATSSNTDPFGNALSATAGVTGSGVFEAGNTLITPQGILTYSALPPALGGLVSSAGVAAAFTDNAGNAVLKGDSSYDNSIPGFSLATSQQSGTFFIFSAAGPGGPWTQLAKMGGVQNDGETHFQAIGGSHLVADTLWFALAPGGFGREVWNDMRPLSNQFVGTISGRYPPQYKLEADGTVNIGGYVQFPNLGGPNWNGVTFATLPAAYRPSLNTGHKWAVMLETNVAPVGTPNCQIDTSGNIQFHNIPASGLNGTIAAIYGRYPISSLIGA